MKCAKIRDIVKNLRLLSCEGLFV